MAVVIERKCEYCDFYEALGDSGGSCRYNPPTVLNQISSNTIENAAFPFIKPGSRCGKFKPSPEAKDSQ